MTFGAAQLWLVACLVPPAVMLLVWPSPPTATVAELLYAVDKPEQEGRKWATVIRAAEIKLD